MDTAEGAESQPRNPDDEFNFADYDDEGMRFKFDTFNKLQWKELNFYKRMKITKMSVDFQMRHKWQL